MLETLDQSGVDPQGLLWLHFHHLRDWRLTVISDLVDTLGRRKTYTLVEKVLEKRNPMEGLTIFDVHLASPSEIMPKVLGGLIHIENGAAELIDCRVNDQPVDAVVYRLRPGRSRSEAARAARTIERKIDRLPAEA